MKKRRAAIYSRKSKFTGKGDSVENQVNICKNYIQNTINKTETIYQTDDILLFEDEGYSGGNTKRPQFQKMMQAVKNKQIAVIIVYRLDRITRSITDFANVLDELKKYDVKFVSVSENFGDYSPMATAMMFMTSIFSQFEREIIAERIRDNMLELAKGGRWLGGNTPLGFNSEEVSHIDENGKIRKSYKLVPIIEEIDMVKLIYQKFLEFNSLSALETYLINANIKTKNGVNYSRFSLRCILTNPVYVIADNLIFDYFLGLNCQVYNDSSKYDGVHGIMPFNRTKQQKGRSNKERPYNEWIIAIGQHKGIISSVDWIKVQNMINENKDKTFRKTKNTSALLSGLLICKNCGSYMRPKLGRINKEGIQSFYYVCELKEKSHGNKCNIANVNGLLVDQMVVNELKQMQSNKTGLLKKLNQDNNKLNHFENERDIESRQLQEKIETNQKAIDNLLDKLAFVDSIELSDILLNKISVLQSENKALINKQSLLRESVHISLANQKTKIYMAKQLASFSEEFHSLEIPVKRSLLGIIIENMDWDGNNINIHLLGPNSFNRMIRMFPDSEDRE